LVRICIIFRFVLFAHDGYGTRCTRVLGSPACRIHPGQMCTHPHRACTRDQGIGTRPDPGRLPHSTLESCSSLCASRAHVFWVEGSPQRVHRCPWPGRFGPLVLPSTLWRDTMAQAPLAPTNASLLRGEGGAVAGGADPIEHRNVSAERVTGELLESSASRITPRPAESLCRTPLTRVDPLHVARRLVGQALAAIALAGDNTCIHARGTWHPDMCHPLQIDNLDTEESSNSFGWRSKPG
jgi:hypothetical protein